MSDQPHRSRNSLHWRTDMRLRELMGLPAWAAFHRACGSQGLFFDDIDPVGRSTQYGAVAFRLERTKDGYFNRFLVAEGRGDGPIGAVLATYRNALAAGFAVDAGLAGLLTGEPVASSVTALAEQPLDEDIAELIG